MTSEKVFYINELEKLDSDLTGLQIEFRAAKTPARGALLEKFEDRVAEGKDHIKQLELAVERNNPDLKDWKEKLKAWNMAISGLKTMYVTDGQEDDGMFDSEANTVVKNQNDKLNGAIRMVSDSKAYGQNTIAEMSRQNNKLKSAREKTNAINLDLKDSANLIKGMMSTIQKNKRIYYGVIVFVFVIIAYIVILRNWL
jgi:Snare region anchored in the vesicle membrane C-terminus